MISNLETRPSLKFHDERDILCYVVGDAVWDLLAARRAGMLSVGLLSGGYGQDELIQAGAFRVYRDPQDLFESLDELGVTLPG